MLASTIAPPRPLPRQASKTIISADLRTRHLAEAMVRLNAEGEATRAALLREGFSAHELDHLGTAANALARNLFVREDKAPEPTDDELVEALVSRLLPRLDAAALRQAAAGLSIDPDRAAHIWPRLCTRLARQVAVLPFPGAPITQGQGAAS